MEHRNLLKGPGLSQQSTVIVKCSCVGAVEPRLPGQLMSLETWTPACSPVTRPQQTVLCSGGRCCSLTLGWSGRSHWFWQVALRSDTVFGVIFSTQELVLSCLTMSSSMLCPALPNGEDWWLSSVRHTHEAF